MHSINPISSPSQPLLSDQENSKFPFKLIKALASDKIWVDLTTAFCLRHTKVKIDENRARTCCLETIRALSLIFLRNNQAIDVYNDLFGSHITFNYVKLNDGTELVIRFINVFYGAKRENEEEPNKKSDFLNAQALTNLYEQHRNKFIEKPDVFYNELKNLKYDFNKPIISELRSYIYRHRTSINKTTSYIYLVAILQPKNDMSLVYHCFTLEQFCCNGTDLYRIYQSSQSAYSLSENLAKKKYGPDGENCENWVQINELLNKTTELLSPCSNLSKNEKDRIQKKYFGVIRFLQTPTYFDEATFTLYGISFRYKVIKVMNFDNWKYLVGAGIHADCTEIIDEFLLKFKEINKD